MFRVSKGGIGYYRLVSPVDDYYVSVKHGEKGYEDDEHIQRKQRQFHLCGKR